MRPGLVVAAALLLGACAAETSRSPAAIDATRAELRERMRISEAETSDYPRLGEERRRRTSAFMMRFKALAEQQSRLAASYRDSFDGCDGADTLALQSTVNESARSAYREWAALRAELAPLEETARAAARNHPVQPYLRLVKEHADAVFRVATAAAGLQASMVGTLASKECAALARATRQEAIALYAAPEFATWARMAQE